MTIDIIKVLAPSVFAFFVGIAITPFISHYLYKYKLWKKKPRTEHNTISEAFKTVHNTKDELSTPRIGGVIVWISVAITIIAIYIFSILFPSGISEKLNFLSRNQTLLPLFALIASSILGLIDDFTQIFGWGNAPIGEGISRWTRIGVIFMIAIISAFWFYFKLGVSSVYIPFFYDFELGVLFIPFFILVILGVFSSSVIDGIDGLAGGVFVPIFFSYTAIAFFNNQIDLAAFSAVITGALLAFLWFNIPPARFYLGETGIMGLTVVLGIIAFLTNAPLLLLVIALPLVATSLSTSIQLFSKKFLNRKVFKMAPLHHHFEVLGWPKYKITMRYWIISWICSIIGLIIALVG